jgi:hypothetical protein
MLSRAEPDARAIRSAGYVKKGREKYPGPYVSALFGR